LELRNLWHQVLLSSCFGEMLIGDRRGMAMILVRLRLGSVHRTRF
jgi:hypothetical protein